MSATNNVTPIGTLRHHATVYAQRGFEIFPVNPADKTPLVSQKEATYFTDPVESWWTHWPDALIGHRISPFEIILDVDPRHGGLDTWNALKEQMPKFTTRVHYSGRGDGGGHIWFQRPGDKLSIAKLVSWAKERKLGHELGGGRWSCGIDLLRHEHRYSILPPSPHPETHDPYRWDNANGLNIEPAPCPQFLCDLLVADEPLKFDRPTRNPNPQSSIADWFSQSQSWGTLLSRHGWVLVAGDGEGDGSRWRHPNATAAYSATIRYGCLFVYSPNTAFEPTSTGDTHGYTRFAAFALLEHRGDQHEAARTARELKDGKKPKGATVKQPSRIEGKPDAAGENDQASNEVENPAPQALEFRTIAELAADVDSRPHPGFLCRPVWPADSYGVIGAEQKAGKTWMVLDLVTSVAAGGSWLESFPVERRGPVVVFLGEGGERKMLRRLRAVAKHKNVELETLPIHLCMRVPHLTSADHLAEMHEKVAEVKPVLVIIDPLYLAARGAKGSDLYEMGEHLESVQHLCQQHESALVVVHHWNKTGEGTGAKRMSGAGPAEWGRVLVSASVVHRSTDLATKATTVTVAAEFTGDEIPELSYRFRRRIWTENPDDLESAMGYAVEALGESAEGSGVNRSAQRVRAVLGKAGRAISVRSIGDELPNDEVGIPLKRATIDEALRSLRVAGLVEVVGLDGYGGNLWGLTSSGNEIKNRPEGIRAENIF